MEQHVERAALAMEEMIFARGHVSMTELERAAAEHLAEVEGDLTWIHPDDPNIWFWYGVSEEFMDAMLVLQQRGNVQADPASALVYFIDGKAIKLPLVKRPPKAGYKDPHWLPVVFNPVGPDEQLTPRD